jgi:hypothetical protein
VPGCSYLYLYLWHGLHTVAGHSARMVRVCLPGRCDVIWYQHTAQPLTLMYEHAARSTQHAPGRREYKSVRVSCMYVLYCAVRKHGRGLATRITLPPPIFHPPHTDNFLIFRMILPLGTMGNAHTAMGCSKKVDLSCVVTPMARTQKRHGQTRVF